MNSELWMNTMSLQGVADHLPADGNLKDLWAHLASGVEQLAVNRHQKKELIDSYPRTGCLYARLQANTYVSLDR
jgi:hypothetical protein